MFGQINLPLSQNLWYIWVWLLAMRLTTYLFMCFLNNVLFTTVQALFEEVQLSKCDRLKRST